MSIRARSQSISRHSERNCRAHWPGLVRSAAFLHFAIIIDRIISWTNGDCMVLSAYGFWESHSACFCHIGGAKLASASKLLGAALAIVRGAILAHSFCRKSSRSFWSHAGSSNFGVLHVLHLIRDGQFWVLHALHAHDQRRVRCHFGSASASGSSLDTNFRQVGQHKKANRIWRQNFL